MQRHGGWKLKETNTAVLVSATSRADKAERELAELKKTNSSLRRQITSLNTEHDDYVSTLRHTIVSLETKNTELKAKLDIEESAPEAELDTALAKLATARRLNRDLEAWQTKISQMISELSDSANKSWRWRMFLSEVY